jgi:hypothetical protein
MMDEQSDFQMEQKGLLKDTLKEIRILKDNGK